MSTPDLLIECKRTNATTQITLKAGDLESLERNALRDSKIPVLQFEIGTNKRRRYVVLTEDDFVEHYHGGDL